MVDCLVQCGVTKPLTQIKLADLPSLVRNIALQTTILKVKAALDQFVNGIKETGLLSCIQGYPDFFKDLFVKPKIADCLTAGKRLVNKNSLIILNFISY